MTAKQPLLEDLYNMKRTAPFQLAVSMQNTSVFEELHFALYDYLENKLVLLGFWFVFASHDLAKVCYKTFFVSQTYQTNVVT